MTTLHLGSRWATRLDILLTTAAKTLLNQLCTVDAKGPAEAIMRSLGDAGDLVPDGLAVRNSYHHICLYRELDITHLLVFFDADFRNISLHGVTGVIPLHVVDPGLCEFCRGVMLEWAMVPTRIRDRLCNRRGESMYACLKPPQNHIQFPTCRSVVGMGHGAYKDTRRTM